MLDVFVQSTFMTTSPGCTLAPSVPESVPNNVRSVIETPRMSPSRAWFITPVAEAGVEAAGTGSATWAVSWSDRTKQAAINTRRVNCTVPPEWGINCGACDTQQTKPTTRS